MRRVPIQARRGDPDPKRRFTEEVMVILGNDIENDYDVFEKPFPDGLPDQWMDPDDGNSKQIRWISNFEVRKKDGTPINRLANNKTYTVELGQGSGDLVCFFDGGVNKLASRSQGGFVQADLDRGDPPIGWSK